MSRVTRIVASGALAFATGGCMFWIGHQPAIVYVAFAPPTPPVEVIVAGPGPRYAWRPGYFRWDSRAYIWEPGAWITIAPGYREWVSGQWEHDARGWYWVEGHWR